MELGQQRLVVVELQRRTADLVAIHLVEHLDEGILELHIGACHPRHAERTELQLTFAGLILAEEAIAVRTAGNHRIGRIEHKGEGIGLTVDRRGGDPLHLRKFPRRSFERGVSGTAAAGRHCSQSKGCHKKHFHKTTYF